MSTPSPQRPPRPFLLSLGMGLSFFVGAFLIIGAICGAAGLVDMTAFQDTALGSWVLPVWTLAMLTFGALLLGIGFGIRSRSPWSRYLMIGFWALVAAMSLVNLALREKADVMWVIALPLAAWYLFAKRNVVAFYGKGREA